MDHTQEEARKLPLMGHSLMVVRSLDHPLGILLLAACSQDHPLGTRLLVVHSSDLPVGRSYQADRFHQPSNVNPLGTLMVVRSLDHP